MRIFAAVKSAVLSAVVVIGSTLGAQAVTIDGVFSLGGSSFSEPGLVMATSTTSGAFQLDLTAGQSTTFDLFDIWATENRVNGNNTRTSSLLATFTLPALGASGSATASTRGVGGIFQYASLTWGGPVLLNFGNGGLLQIVLDNADYSFGFFGLGQGQANGATIRLTATLVSAPVPVPLPASGLALSAALGLAGITFRRRRRAG